MQLGTIIFATLVLLGQLTFALGGILNKFWLMEVGRLIFGYFIQLKSKIKSFNFKSHSLELVENHLLWLRTLMQSLGLKAKS